VLFPTPVSPTTMMAYLADSSFGMASIPLFINCLSFSRLSFPYIMVCINYMYRWINWTYKKEL